MNHISHSQYNEDIRLLEFFNSKKEGFYVEVGAYDGITLSNSYLFEKIGWKGILVEAIPDIAKLAEKNRPLSIIEQCACVAPDEQGTIEFEVLVGGEGMSSRKIINKKIIDSTKSSLTKIQVPAKTLDNILEGNNVKEIDFITIDVEGFELQVLKGFSIAKWKPLIVILESNSLFPDDRILRFMFSNNYRYLQSTGVNVWFIYDKIIIDNRIWLTINSYIKIYFNSVRNIFQKIVNRIRNF